MGRRLGTAVAAICLVALAACGKPDDKGGAPVNAVGAQPTHSGIASPTPHLESTSAVPTGPPTARPTQTPSRRPPSSRPPAPATSAPGSVYPHGAISTTGTTGVALTFDDGPTWEGTKQMLAVLKEHGVKATFCVLGKMAKLYPSRIQEIARDGHALCNHSYNHDYKLGTWTEDRIRADLQATNDAIHAAVPGATISYFRHPGGSWTPLAVKVAASMGMTSLHWTVDPADHKKPPPQQIVDRVLAHTRPGSIVLLHDGGGGGVNTVEAVTLMLPTLKTRFKLIPLPPRASP